MPSTKTSTSFSAKMIESLSVSSARTYGSSTQKPMYRFSLSQSTADRVSYSAGTPLMMSTKRGDLGARCQTGLSRFPSISIGVGVRKQLYGWFMAAPLLSGPGSGGEVQVRHGQAALSPPGSVEPAMTIMVAPRLSASGLRIESQMRAPTPARIQAAKT